MSHKALPSVVINGVRYVIAMKYVPGTIKSYLHATNIKTSKRVSIAKAPVELLDYIAIADSVNIYLSHSGNFSILDNALIYNTVDDAWYTL